MTDGGGGCCRCCFSFIVTSGLTALFMWLSLRASNPVCSIQEFYVPALNRSANSAANTSIYFHLKLDNGNKDKGIYYDALNLTIYYAPNLSSPIANQTFSNFYQGHNKKAHRKQTVETRGVPWDEVRRGVFNGSSSAVFRVDLATAVRFKIVGWKTRRRHLRLGANLTVGDTGEKSGKKKGVKLKSGAPPELPCYRARLGPLTIFLTSLFIIQL